MTILLAMRKRFRPGSGSSIGRRQPTRSSISSLERIPEAAARATIVAVRTMPIRAAASDRCSGSVHGRWPLPSAAAAWAALRANIFCTPTDVAAVMNGSRSAGFQRLQSWL